jgi:peptidoglycan/xylan/chitin deacetylase (PgdA/CDA1 family)
MMNRRQFTKIVGLGALALGTGRFNVSQTTRGPQIAITMDDFGWRNAVYQTAAERNKSTLGTLEVHSIKAALFVVGRNIESDEGRLLLSEWNKAGHLIGNHTYSHQNFNAPTVTLQQYEDDILRADTVLKNFSGFRKYFRFPMLKEGDTAAKRDGVRSFLAQHGYRVGHVTIDTADWAISARLTERLSKELRADPKPYRDFYLEHMWDRAQYYDSLARRVLGRSVKHTILVHYNLLNGLFLGELIQMFKAKDWQFIDAEEAFTDPVYSKKPNVLPAGESIVWALAKADGTIAKSLKYPAEDGEAVVTQMKQLGL